MNCQGLQIKALPALWTRMFRLFNPSQPVQCVAAAAAVHFFLPDHRFLIHPLSRPHWQIKSSWPVLCLLSFVIQDLNSIKSRKGEKEKDLTWLFSGLTSTGLTCLVFTIKKMTHHVRPFGGVSHSPCLTWSLSVCAGAKKCLMKLKSVRWYNSDCCFFSTVCRQFFRCCILFQCQWRILQVLQVFAFCQANFCLFHSHLPPLILPSV